MKNQPATAHPLAPFTKTFVWIFSIGLLATQLHAAPISWGTPTTTLDVDDIDLSGSLVHAGSWGTSNLLVDVGGLETIPFEDRPINTTDGEAGVTSIDEYGTAFADWFTNDTGNVEFNEILDSTAGGGTKVFTLEGLTPGAVYQVQLFAADQRATEGARSMKWSDQTTSGSGNESAVFLRSDIASTLGTFTADRSSQVVFGHGVNNPDTILNAYVLRQLVAAPPGVYLNPPDAVRIHEGRSGTYDLQTTTTPASPITILVSAPADLSVSLDGSSFSASVSAILDGITPVTITYRGESDGTAEPTETHAITHAITVGDGAAYPGAIVIDDLAVTLDDALIGQPGDFAVYSNAGGTVQDLGDAASIVNTFSTIDQAPLTSYVLQPSGQDILLSAGRHLVLYNIRVDNLSGPTRAELLAHLSLSSGGTVEHLASGWSQGFIRNTTGADEAVLSGGAIVTASANDLLRLHTERSDANVGKIVRIPVGGAAIQLLKLDDGLDVLRLSDSGTNTAPNVNNTFADITYDQVDETTGTALSFTPGASSVTLNAAGHYLVMANTHLDRTLASPNGTRLAFTQRLLLDGSEVTGSKTTTYIRGMVDDDSCYQGTSALGMIIESAAGNTLQLQLAQEGTQLVDIIGSRTSLSLVKLPSTGAFIKLEDTGGQDLNPVARTPLTFDTRNGSPDLAHFNHSTGSSQVIMSADGPYLFLGAFFCDMDTTDRQVCLQNWTVDSQLSPYGQTAQYSRNDVTFKNGDWSGFITDLAASSIVEMNVVRLAAGGLLPGHSVGLQGASLVNLTTQAVLLTNNGLGVNAGSTTVITTNKLKAADASVAPSAITYTLDSAPNGGTLRNNGVVVGTGGSFSQEAINQGLVTFEAGPTSGADFGFGFALSNGGANQAAGYFQIQVAAPPVIANESGTANEDTLLSTLNAGVTNLFANDTGEGLSLSTFDATSTLGAQVNVSTNGTFTYDPDYSIALQAMGAGDNLVDTFTYTLTDVIGSKGTGTVTITVSGIEDHFGAGNVVIDDTLSPLFESTSQAFTVDLVANDGTVRTENGNTNVTLICNYDARGSLGLGVWENTGSLGGTAMDWILRTGVTHDRSVTSTHLGITAAYAWDGTPNATAILRGIDSINDILPGVDLANASMEFWLKPNAADLGQISTIFETGGGTGSGLIIDNGILKAANAINTATVSYDLLTDSQGLLGGSATGEFFQVLWTIDFTNDVNTLYINGVQVDATANPATVDWDGGDAAGLGHFQGSNHGGFQNGAAGTAYDTYYNGSMAIYRIYNEALSPTEVFQNFQAINSGATDMEGDTLTIAGLYNAGGSLVSGTDTPVPLTSGAVVTLNSTTGDFTYDSSSIPGITDLTADQTLVDTFSYQLIDGTGTAADGQVSVVIHGVNNGADDLLAATETLVTTFAANQLVGNDQHSPGTPNPFIAFNASTVSPAELAAGIIANAGTAGAAFDATVNAGSLVTPKSNFGAIGNAWEGLTATAPSLDLQGVDDGTFEIWFKPRLSTGLQALFETGGNGTGFSIAYDGDLNEIRVSVDAGTDTDPSVVSVLSASGVSYETFNQLVVVLDRDTLSGDGNDDLAVIYLNNDRLGGFDPTPDAQFLNTGGGVNDWSGTDGAGLGVMNNSASLNLGLQPFTGQLARFSFYTRALSTTEMAVNFDAVAQAVQIISPATTALGASLVLNPDGSLVYDATTLNVDIPAGNVVQDTFTYTIEDGVGGFSSATVTVDVTGIGTFAALDDAASVAEDSPIQFDPRTNDLGAASATIAFQLDVATYQGDFQPGGAANDPADFRNGSGFGWQYLWNAPTAWDTGTFDGSTGPIGSVADYDLLVWDPATTNYAVNADGVITNSAPGNFLRLDATGGHPGLPAGAPGLVTNTLERFAIAAYTVASNGTYAITSSTLTRAATGGEAVRVLTAVNSNLRSSTRINPGATGSFDEVLGELQSGDTIYVAVGPNANQGADAFTWDFTISRVPGSTLNPAGAVSTDGSTVSYTPLGRLDDLAPGDTFIERFGYFILSGGQIASAELTVTVQGENDAPQGIADTYTTDEDTPLADLLLTNDTDVDSGHAENLSVAEVQGASTNVGVAAATIGGGIVTVQADGRFVYDPNGAFEPLSEGETASDSFSYRVADPLGLTATNTTLVSLTITGVNDGIFATSNAYTTASDMPVSGNLITDDTGAGVDSSIDLNDTLAVQSLDLTGTLGLVSAATSRVVGVQGSVVVSNDVVATVSFGAGRFTNPVIIASPPTLIEVEATTLLISNVNAVAGTFDISMKEQPEAGAAASDGDGALHAAETVEWMVLEAGSYQLANGRRLDVGTLSTTATRQAGGPAGWATVNFASSFNSAPVVFHTVQTVNGTAAEQHDFYGTRMNGLANTNSFQIALNDHEGDPNPRTTAETIGWMAMEVGDGYWDGNNYEVGLTGASVIESSFTINYLRTYGSIPRFIPAMQTILGGDSTQLRMQNLGATSAEVFAREDRFTDAELSHAAEQVAYLALAGDDDIEVYLLGEVPGSFTYDPNGAFDGLANGATATDTFSYVLVDDKGSKATNTVTITISGSSLGILAQWRSDNGFITIDGSGLNEGNLEDKEGDGQLNLQEFAFGTDPNIADNVPLTADIGGGTFVPGRIVVLNDGNLWGLFARRVDHLAAGLTYTPQFSHGLDAWVDGIDAPLVVVPDTGTGYDLLAVPFTVFPDNGELGSYFRVRVTYTAP
jgi:VCBS repeat-containing protein